MPEGVGASVSFQAHDQRRRAGRRRRTRAGSHASRHGMGADGAARGSRSGRLCLCAGAAASAGCFASARRLEKSESCLIECGRMRRGSWHGMGQGLGWSDAIGQTEDSAHIRLTLRSQHHLHTVRSTALPLPPPPRSISPRTSHAPTDIRVRTTFDVLPWPRPTTTKRPHRRRPLLLLPHTHPPRTQRHRYSSSHSRSTEKPASTTTSGHPPPRSISTSSTSSAGPRAPPRALPARLKAPIPPRIRIRIPTRTRTAAHRPTAACTHLLQRRRGTPRQARAQQAPSSLPRMAAGPAAACGPTAVPCRGPLAHPSSTSPGGHSDQGSCPRSAPHSSWASW